MYTGGEDMLTGKLGMHEWRGTAENTIASTKSEGEGEVVICHTVL